MKKHNIPTRTFVISVLQNLARQFYIGILVIILMIMAVLAKDMLYAIVTAIMMISWISWALMEQIRILNTMEPSIDNPKLNNSINQIPDQKDTNTANEKKDDNKVE